MGGAEIRSMFNSHEMKTYFNKFDFISDSELRRNLVLDYKEVLTCLNRQCSKGAVVLAGGIVEAILINKALSLTLDSKRKVIKKYLELSSERKERKIEDMELFYLIKTLENLKIITSPQASRCDVLRDYRNLIHPYKKGKRPNKSDASSVIKLLNDLLDEFGKDIESESKDQREAELFLFHSKYLKRRERKEYREILGLFHKKGDLQYEELLALPSFSSKDNPSKSLIAHLNYLKERGLCNYKPKSWKGYPINRYEKWTMESNVRKIVGKYLKAS